MQDAVVDALGYGFAEIVESLVDFGADLKVLHVDQVGVSYERGTPEDAQGTPTQSNIPPSILAYEDELFLWW